MDTWIEDVSLKGKVVELLPMKLTHADELITASREGELWKLWYTSVPTPENTVNYIQQALLAKHKNGDFPFVVKHLNSNRIIGSTRYCHVDNSNKRLEIGYTWYSKNVQRTAVNTEVKLLLLTHAFETLKTIAVEFRTHWFNQQSRKAIERLGAKQDGVLRNHQRLADGSLRDTVIFSIIESEWPSVKNHLNSGLFI